MKEIVFVCLFVVFDPCVRVDEHRVLSRPKKEAGSTIC